MAEKWKEYEKENPRIAKFVRENVDGAGLESGLESIAYYAGIRRGYVLKELISRIDEVIPGLVISEEQKKDLGKLVLWYCEYQIRNT
jgi:hypothetical protein